MEPLIVFNLQPPRTLEGDSAILYKCAECGDLVRSTMTQEHAKLTHFSSYYELNNIVNNEDMIDPEVGMEVPD